MITKNEVNVEEIMKQIRADIVYKKENNLYPATLKQEIGRFKDNNMNSKELAELLKLLKEMKQHSFINHNPMMPSTKPIIGPVLTLAKKIIRKLTSWYFQGITEQVNLFNNLTVKAMDYVYREIETSNDLNLPFWWNNYSEFKHQFPEISSPSGKQEIISKCFEKKDDVLDIGCGDGDFLHELQQNNIKSRGIDINSVTVEQCLSKKLSVTHADALDYLSNVPSGSLGGIYMGKLLEHLSLHYVHDLLKESEKKLRADSYLVIESLNPANLTTASARYSRELSHNKLLHPETLSFVLDLLGFKNIEIQYVAPLDEKEKLKKLKSAEGSNGTEAENIKTLNNNIERLNSVMFGNQEYIVTAKKAARK